MAPIAIMMASRAVQYFTERVTIVIELQGFLYALDSPMRWLQTLS